MKKAKLPNVFGVGGVAIGLSFMGWSWYVYRYNPFHFPSSSTPGNFTPPPLYNLLNDLTLILVPGVWLQFLTMDDGNLIAAIMWLLAVGINFLIYYGLGMAISAIWGRIRYRRSERLIG